jgi:hypothetical protein
MGASFAKAVIPRPPKRRETVRESDWSLGWVFPIKTDAPRPEADLTPPLRLHEDEANIEDRS